MRLEKVSVFSPLKCKHALAKRQIFQLIRAAYALFFSSEKNNVFTGEGEYVDEIPTTINEILDVSISFLNDHLEETLGSTKIEEIHSKCINLAQVSVSS